MTGEPPRLPDREYLRFREMAERAAAKRAPCDAARRVHQQLAQLYSERLHGE